MQAGSSPDEVVKTLDNLFSITTVPVVSSLKSSKEKTSEIPFHNSSAAAAQILEYKHLQQAHSQAQARLKSEDNKNKRTTPLTYQYQQPPSHSSNNI